MPTHSVLLRHAMIAATALSALIATSGLAIAHDEPIRRGDQLIFPENANIPRFLTDTEQRYIHEFPLRSDQRAVTPPPTGPIHCVAEYEPMEGLLMAWEAQTTILTQMARWVTTTGNGKVYMMFDSASEQSSAMSSLAAGGVNTANVVPVIATTDSVWIRDYGPRYIYEGDCRAIVDHTYNRPRPNDNLQPAVFANHKRHAFYEHQLVHGGGNYHLNALDLGWATRLIVNENPGLSESQIITIWQTYQNVTTSLQTPFPTGVDATQHIDMWMQVCGDNTIIISDWPTQSGTTQDIICDSAAATLAANGWNVFRTPAVRNSTAHYTYTNMVIFNDIVLLPMYTNAGVTAYNSQALGIVQAAMPGKTIYQINCESIVTLAGVMHCIVMHVPAHRGGANPTAWLKNHRGGGTLSHGQQITINWISDDDVSVSNVDVLLSTDGGQTFPITLANAVPNSWAFNWTVPSNINTANGRFRIVVRDGQGNTGHDQSTGDIIIGDPSANPADITGDGVVGVGDLLAVINQWGACPAPPQECPADIAPSPNGDGVVSVGDLLMVINNWG